jgi:hypothetical protein
MHPFKIIHLYSRQSEIWRSELNEGLVLTITETGVQPYQVWSLVKSLLDLQRMSEIVNLYKFIGIELLKLYRKSFEC